MKHTAKYIPLNEVISQYMNEAGIPEGQRLRLWNISVRGLKELGMDVFSEPKTRILNVLPNKTVDLPADYLQWSKVGIVNDQGEVATLRHNPNLTLYRAEQAEEYLDPNDETSEDSGVEEW
jgi:hypothetical protein